MNTDALLHPDLLASGERLVVAMLCGILIGLERQHRHRSGGLHTNALVALGAAAFVLIGELAIGESSPTRVAAQVSTGIGFLCGGVILRDGFSVHGLNTAATFWCSAAIGSLAGSGLWPQAMMATTLVVFANVVLHWVVDRYFDAPPADGHRVMSGRRADDRRD